MPTATGHTTAIRASRVIGTDLYNKPDTKIGKVDDVVLDKTGERILFVVVSVGGATTTSHTHHVVPWSALDYNEQSHGYFVPFGIDQIVNGPGASNLEELTRNDGAMALDTIRKHYETKGA